MAQPIEFPERNDTLQGGGLGVANLPVYRDGAQVVSCWALTPAEMQEIKITGCIWIKAMGQSQPPLMVMGHYPFVASSN